MKKIKFTFIKGYKATPIEEVVTFGDQVTDKQIGLEFDDWYFNEIDRVGIDGFWEEVEE